MYPVVIQCAHCIEFLEVEVHSDLYECNLCEECYEKFYGEAPNLRTNSTL